jgi:hypothetical protein
MNVSVGPEHCRVGAAALSCDVPMVHGVAALETWKNPDGYSRRMPPPLGTVPLADILKDTTRVMLAEPEIMDWAGRILKSNAVTFPVRDDSHKNITAFELAGRVKAGTDEGPSVGSLPSCP